ncbi:MAG: RHS repeat-associated core domain-containing protein, partial [Bacteroides sp.]
FESADFKNGSNQLIEYSYDQNGILTKYLNKGISIIFYNSLNLSVSLSIANASGSALNNYTYSADGRKLKVEMKYGINRANTKMTDYVGNMIYENGSLKRILVDGGYIENDKYYYYIQDHLGNNRVVAQADGSVLQVSHYYSFGMTFTENNTGDSKVQPYKYNGKEFDGERGLNVYDYSARYMDPAFGRFVTVDPLAEKLTPYHFCANNQVLFVDYDGRDYGVHFDHDNQTVTIKATYHASSTDIASAQQSASFWNNQSGNYTYIIGKGDNAATYTVNFELTATEVAIDLAGSELGQLNSALSADKRGEGNVYHVVSDSDLSSNTNGTTSGGNYVRVKDTRKTTDTGAHEVGHTLGMGHTGDGVMTSISSSSRTNNTNTSDVKAAIINPVKGKVNYVSNTDGSGTYAGKGTVRNSTPYTNVNTDYGGQQRTANEPDKLKGRVR